MNKPFNCFIGRYQGNHKGHMTIFAKYLDQGEPVLIMVRDVPTDEKNPFTPEEVKFLWEKVYSEEIKNGLVKVIIIPDIASVNYGRSVGYKVVEIEVDSSISNISATEIRSKIKNNDDSWKEFVDESIHEDLEKLLMSKLLKED
jgi:nicotinamide mononucleotide adenylyltransferase